ncbi:MAG: hypothetical protein M1821_008869 [Bathelium mastoideum]|nr:MAG: hypothetical protein M1821_008869 [Bathelium mastoideum]KAI9687554.1 MAG: hypothetical protein M1822_002164 [Bathelium mastoideum]
MTSSIITLVSTATQSIYSAANSFQDVFARFRRAQWLPARSLALGMVLDVSHASTRPDIQHSLVRNGIYGTTESELVLLLDSIFTPIPPRVTTNTTHYSDDFADAHALSGLEPSKIRALDPAGLGADFVWSTDPRFAGVRQNIRSHQRDRQRAGRLVSGTCSRSRRR